MYLQCRNRTHVQALPQRFSFLSARGVPDREDAVVVAVARSVRANTVRELQQLNTKSQNRSQVRISNPEYKVL